MIIYKLKVRQPVIRLVGGRWSIHLGGASRGLERFAHHIFSVLLTAILLLVLIHRHDRSIIRATHVGNFIYAETPFVAFPSAFSVRRCVQTFNPYRVVIVVDIVRPVRACIAA